MEEEEEEEEEKEEERGKVGAGRIERPRVLRVLRHVDLTFSRHVESDKRARAFHPHVFVRGTTQKPCSATFATFF